MASSERAAAQCAALRLVRADERAPSELVAFCGHCGARPVTPIEGRVCAECGLGLILETDAEAVPRPDDAFLVFDSYLSVCAVSSEAERLLSANEVDLVHRHISEVLMPADVEAQSTSKLATAVIWAAGGDHASGRVLVRPVNTFGVRLSALIASCGPSKAALVVLR